jgi:hypothetical protein
MNLVYQRFVDKSRTSKVQPEASSSEYGPDVESVNDLYHDMILVSTESFRNYAKSIGAEYEFDDNPESMTIGGHRHSASVYFEWLEIIYDPEYDKYDKIAVFDLDIVANTKENIFEASDADVYGVNESDYRMRHNECAPWDEDERVSNLYRDKIERSGFKMIGSVAGIRGACTTSKYMHLQGGMMVFSREGRIRAREEFSDWKDWLYEDGVCNNDPQQRVNCLYYDDAYVSVNVTNLGFNYETISPLWMDNPLHIAPWVNPPSSDCYGIKFPHFRGFLEKRWMLQWALQQEFALVTKYISDYSRKMNWIELAPPEPIVVHKTVTRYGTENML